MDFENTPYQRDKVEKQIEPLTSFLEDMQCKSGLNKPKMKPYFGNNKTSLDAALMRMQNITEAEEDDENLDDENLDAEPEEVDDTEIPDDTDTDPIDTDEDPEADPEAEMDEPEDPDSVEDVFIGPGQRYFMGASGDPKLTIVTKVTDNKIDYYQYPFSKKQQIDKEIGVELLAKGSRTWLDQNSGNDSQEDLKNSIESVLNSRPGEKVNLSDFQFNNIQVKYIGSETGDKSPWLKLEQEYDVTVTGVLTNKQTYNVRLTNKELREFEDKISEADQVEFRIKRIVKEDAKFFGKLLTECKDSKVRVVSPSEEPWVLETMENAKTNNYSYDGINAGDIVTVGGKDWKVVDFISLGKEMGVNLYCPKRMERMDYVPMKKIERDDQDALGVNKDKRYTIKDPVDIEFPKSGEDGITQTQKNIDKEGRSTGIESEELTTEEALINNVTNYINTNNNIQEECLTPMINSLVVLKEGRKKYSHLAKKAFHYAVNLSCKRYFHLCEGEFLGESYRTWQDMFPVEVRKSLSDQLREEFESQAKLLLEAPEDEMDVGGEEDPEAEVDPEADGEDSEEDNLDWNKNELDIMSKMEGFTIEKGDDGQEQIPTFSWDSNNKTYNIKIFKTKDKNDMTTYTAKTDVGGEVDDSRPQSSKPFNGPEDTAVLRKFVQELKINEDDDLDDDLDDEKNNQDDLDTSNDDDDSTNEIEFVMDENAGAVGRSYDELDRGLGSLVKSLLVFHKRGEVASAKRVKSTIDGIIKKKNLDPRTVYYYYGDPNSPENKKKSIQEIQDATPVREVAEKEKNKEENDKNSEDVDGGSVESVSMGEETITESNKKPKKKTIERVVTQYKRREDGSPIKRETKGNTIYIYKLSKEVKEREQREKEDEKAREKAKKKAKSSKKKSKTKKVNEETTSQKVGQAKEKAKEAQSKALDAKAKAAKIESDELKKQTNGDESDNMISLVSVDGKSATLEVNGVKKKVNQYDTLDKHFEGVGEWTLTELDLEMDDEDSGEVVPAIGLVGPIKEGEPTRIIAVAQDQQVPLG